MCLDQSLALTKSLNSGEKPTFYIRLYNPKREPRTPAIILTVVAACRDCNALSDSGRGGLKNEPPLHSNV